MMIVGFFFKAGGVFALFLPRFIFVCSVSTMFPPHEVSAADSSFPHTDQHFLVPCPLDVGLLFAIQLSVSCQAPAVNHTSIRRVNKGFVPTASPLKQPSFYIG